MKIRKVFFSDWNSMVKILFLWFKTMVPKFASSLVLKPWVYLRIIHGNFFLFPFNFSLHFSLFLSFPFPLSPFLSSMYRQWVHCPRNSDFICLGQALGITVQYFIAPHLLLMCSHYWEPGVLYHWMLTINVDSQILPQAYWIIICILIRPPQAVCMHSKIGEPLSRFTEWTQRFPRTVIFKVWSQEHEYHLGIC